MKRAFVIFLGRHFSAKKQKLISTLGVDRVNFRPKANSKFDKEKLGLQRLAVLFSGNFVSRSWQEKLNSNKWPLLRKTDGNAD